MQLVIRYSCYAVILGALFYSLTYWEIHVPGALNLYVQPFGDGELGTSEFSVIENLQLGFLLVCGLIFALVAHNHKAQRPVALLFAAIALCCLIREMDYFLDVYVIDNLWQVLLVVALAFSIAYTLRHQRRFVTAWARIWPSAGIGILFAGACLLFVFVHLVSHEAFWVSLLGDNYVRVAKLAVEEFTELSGYYLWVVGAIEYQIEVGAITAPVKRSPVPRRSSDRRRGSS